MCQDQSSKTPIIFSIYVISVWMYNGLIREAAEESVSVSHTEEFNSFWVVVGLWAASIKSLCTLFCEDRLVDAALGHVSLVLQLEQEC